MSMYYASFTYLDKNSADQGWMITHFEGDSDSGEMDTFLSTSTVGTDNYNGTKRTMYGSKYNNEATLKITIIKQNGSDFGIVDTREALKWLTGAQQNSWMYLYVGDEARDAEGENVGSKARFRVLGHVQDVKQYKMDARVVGLVIYFESASPWAYSLPQVESRSVAGKEKFPIDNCTDDKYTYTPLNVWFKTDAETLTITNIFEYETVEKARKAGAPVEITEFTNLTNNEEITINDNMMVVSSNSARVFGNSFNFIFPRLKSGTNNLIIEGWGDIKLTYSYCIKLGDCVTKINAASEPICDDYGKIIVDRLSWLRLDDIPNTLEGHGIINAYNKTEIDLKLSNIEREPVKWTDVTFKPTDLQGYGLDDDVYTKRQSEDLFYKKEDTMTKDAINILVGNTKTEFNNAMAQQDETLRDAITDAVANLQIDENELNSMLKSVLT